MTYKLSPSELTYLYEGCKFCFWLKVKHGISQPSMPMPGIFSAIAAKQKDFYEDRRTEQFCPALPPGMVILGEKWVQSKVISGADEQSCFIKGKFDAVVEFDDGSYGVIDFKTAKASDGKAAMYGRQLHAYAYALENPGDGAMHLTPIKKLGLIFFTPDAFEQESLERQIFSGKVIWIEVSRDDEAFTAFLNEVMQVLKEDTPPASAPDCNWCRYRTRMTDFKFAHRDVAFSSKSNEWETPQWLFDDLNEIFHFDIDAAASHEKGSNLKQTESSLNISVLDPFSTTILSFHLPKFETVATLYQSKIKPQTPVLIVPVS